MNAPSLFDTVPEPETITWKIRHDIRSQIEQVGEGDPTCEHSGLVWITDGVAGCTCGAAWKVTLVIEVAKLSDPEEQQLGPFVRGSETSRQAALATYPRQGSQRWKVLMALLEEDQVSPPGRLRGMTREELAGRTGLSPDTVRPRVVELIAGGWIFEGEFTRKTALGNDAALVMLTPAAVERLQREP